MSKPKLINYCLICGNKFYVWPYQIKTNKFCSHKCYWASLAGQVKTYTPVKKDKLYHIFQGIKRRCNNPHEVAYPRYGGRGIKYKWKSYIDFRNDMLASYEEHNKIYGNKDTQIERINNDGHYEKSNCRWATRKEQSRIRKSRVEITYQGKTMSITEWAEYMNIPKIALWLRIKRYNWSIEKALTKHIRKFHT